MSESGDGMSTTEYRDQVWAALNDSTRTSVQVLGSLNDLCSRIEALRTTDMRDLREELGTLAAHMDKFSRAADTTNQLLHQDAEERKSEANQKMEAEEKEKAWRRQMEEKEKEWAKEIERLKLTQQMGREADNRSMLKKVTSELWSVFKGPLAYLLAGVIAWYLYHHYDVPVEVPDNTPKPVLLGGE